MFVGNTNLTRRQGGFSLADPLVLIALVAYVTYPVAKEKLGDTDLKKKEARELAAHLREGLVGYYSVYRSFPVPAEVPDSYDLRMDSGPAVMNALIPTRAESGESSLNPRGIAFYAGGRAKGGARPLSGVTLDLQAGGAALVDPWGNRFNVILDTNANMKSLNPATGREEIPQRIVIWSKGPNGRDDHGQGDDVRLW